MISKIPWDTGLVTSLGPNFHNFKCSFRRIEALRRGTVFTIICQFFMLYLTTKSYYHGVWMKSCVTRTKPLDFSSSQFIIYFLGLPFHQILTDTWLTDTHNLVKKNIKFESIFERNISLQTYGHYLHTHNKKWNIKSPTNTCSSYNKNKICICIKPPAWFPSMAITLKEAD